MENDLEKREKLNNDPDFIVLKRYGYSLNTLVAKYPDGVPDHLIAQALDITEEQVEAEYKSVVKKLQRSLGVL